MIKKKLLLALSTVSIIALASCLGLFFTKIDSLYFRYSRYCPLYKTIISHKKKTIDFATFGSSRSLRAISAGELELAHEDFFGSKIKALEMSRSHRGMGLTYVFIRDLLEQTHVKNILVEYNSTTKSYPVHQQFPKVAKLEDILKDILYYPNIFLGLEYGFYILRQKISDGIYYSVIPPVCNMASGKSEFELDPAKTTVPEHLQTVREKIKKFSFPQKHLKIELTTRDEQRQVKYAKQIIALAKAKGSRVLFYYAPQFYGATPSKKFAAEFQQAFGVPYLIPPDDLIETIGKAEGNMDITHMKESGAKMFSRWLLKSSKELLEATH